MARKINHSDETLGKAKGIYLNGGSLKDVASFLRVSIPTARKALVALGITIRPKGRYSKRAAVVTADSGEVEIERSENGEDEPVSSSPNLPPDSPAPLTEGNLEFYKEGEF